MLSRSIEDYIKAIYALEIEVQKAGTKQIAQRLGVKMASVTGMIKHLAAEGYVKHTPYYGVQLSARGQSVALGLIRRHRLIELFLTRTLDLPWDEVHNDAEVLEHVVSDRLVERMHEVLGFPEFDPHGSPIPRKDGSVVPRQGICLDQLQTDQRGHIVEVEDRDPEFLRYMTGLKLSIGSAVRVRERAPFNGPITLTVGSRTIAIGHEAGARIRVGVDEPISHKRRRKKL